MLLIACVTLLLRLPREGFARCESAASLFRISDRESFCLPLQVVQCSCLGESPTFVKAIIQFILLVCRQAVLDPKQFPKKKVPANSYARMIFDSSPACLELETVAALLRAVEITRPELLVCYFACADLTAC